ncbi:type IV secretion system protein VirB10 [Pseudovibrio denitrificans]|uniref:Type IV secretion system protein VirB10 n=1 Tax=Pseudovibrio denitrificans TaxID=258256 RepID=A0A1I7DVE0_9HYPH|nr:TrbI/VirB10 family protein [Pseudovibrio denitrificans]SFU15639.1 type IV secretion system protein VirB10 [Pseudovibrio denitrificans]
MSVCELFLAVGLSFGGACEPEPVIARGLPPSDEGVFDYKLPPKPKPVAPPAPPPPRIIMAPPIVVEREVSIDAPPRTIIKKEYITVEKLKEPPKPKEPSPFELELQAARAARFGSQEYITSEGVLANGTEGNVPGLDGGLKETAALNVSPPGSSVAGSLAAPQGIDPKNSTYKASGRISTSAVDNSRIVTADRYITGIMETGINSQLADEGTVVIQVSRDVYGYHGANLLVPKGSRMICRYESAKKVGQTRIGFSCERVLMAESRAEIYQLKAKVGDAQGYGGMSGHVDNRWWEKYGTAVTTVAIGAAVESAVTMASTYGLKGSDTIASALTGISENVGELSAKFMEDTVNLRPVIRISQGTRVQIRPEYDWYLAPPTQQ